jgi:hypothetical protein
MPLQKEIELPLFRRGIVTDSRGTKVHFTEALLRQLERNTNRVIADRLLQAPIKLAYDHPVAGTNKEAHGVLSRARYDNGTLYISGTNWSDTLVKDVKRGARLSYSGEFTDDFTFPDPVSGNTVSLGPAVVGLAIQGADRPAFKGLLPLNQIEFAEGTTAYEMYETREELRKAGLVAEHVEGTHYFGEVENTGRFFEEEQETAMDEKDLKAIGDMIKTTVAAAVAPLETKIADTQKSVSQFSEQGKRDSKAHQFCEEFKSKRQKTAPPPPALMAQAEDLLSDSEVTPGVYTKITMLMEKIPAAIVGGTTEGEGGGGGVEEIPGAKSLPKLRKHHFSERTPENSNLIDGALTELKAAKPELFAAAKTVEAEIAITRDFVARRDNGATV